MVTHNFKNLTVVLYTSALFSISSSIFAAGVSADPGDYKALPAGTNLAVAYYQHLTADDVYSNNNKVVDDLGLTLDLGMLRYVRYMEIGGLLMDPQIVLPFAKQQNSLDGTETVELGIYWLVVLLGLIIMRSWVDILHWVAFFPFRQVHIKMIISQSVMIASSTIFKLDINMH